jgi:hypothetical protein
MIYDPNISVLIWHYELGFHNIVCLQGRRILSFWGTFSLLYSRVSGTYLDFLDILLLLIMKVLNQGFLVVKFKSSLRIFYGRHHDLVNRYGIYVISDHGYVSFVVLSSFMIYQRSNTSVDIGWSANAYPFGAPEFTHDFCGVRVAQSLTVCVAFCY